MTKLQNPKYKGNAFERTIANTLTQLTGESFMRVPNSGAIVGATNTITRCGGLDKRQMALMTGDIIPPASMSALIIECKHQTHFSTFPANSILAGKWQPLDKAIKQVITPHNDLLHAPLLFLKGNRSKIIVCTRLHLIQKLTINATEHYTMPSHIVYTQKQQTTEQMPWVLADMKDLLGNKTFLNAFIYYIKTLTAKLDKL